MRVNENQGYLMDKAKLYIAMEINTVGIGFKVWNKDKENIQVVVQRFMKETERMIWGKEKEL